MVSGVSGKIDLYHSEWQIDGDGGDGVDGVVDEMEKSRLQERFRNTERHSVKEAQSEALCLSTEHEEPSQQHQHDRIFHRTSY